MRTTSLKHVLLIFFFILFTIYALPARVSSDTIFLPFVTPLNEWVVDAAVPSPGWPAGIHRYTFSADSVLKNGKYYHELIYSENMSGGPWNSGEGYFREENGRTYKWLEDAPERLIYDFNLGIGDSLPGTDSNQATRYVVQVGTETLLDGIPRKSIIFNSVCGPSRWVEGIGEIEDFLYSEVFCSLWDGPPLSIRCFSTNGQLLYLRPNLSSCYTSATSNLTMQTVRVYPNPSLGYLVLASERDEMPVLLTLYTPLGKPVFETKQFVNKQVELPNLSPGMYSGCAAFSNGRSGWFRVILAN
ncbi:MAG: T9SS type A sorting domain-containing protein [Saprospiraceae bacterium]|nr:T9SS type A sorting domain-containing protein [Saprospiraceae bacterium]